MCLKLKRNNNFGNFSHIKLTVVSHKITKRAIHYFPANNNAPIFLEKCNLEKIIPKKQHHMCHIVSLHVRQFVSLKQNLWFFIPEISEGQAQSIVPTIF